MSLLNNIRAILKYEIILSILLLLIACNSSSQEASSEDIKIGAILPLTGGAASFYGKYATQGLELARDEINANGGIDRKNLTIVYEDSQGQITRGLSAFNKLQAEGITVIIGDIVSGVTLAIAPEAEKNKILLIAPGSASPKLSEAGDYVFRTKVSAQLESKTAADFIKNSLGANRVAFLYQNSDYGFGVFSAMKADLLSLGAEIVGEEKFDIGDADMRTQLLKLKGTGANYILLAGYPQEVGLILKQANELGVTQKFFAHSGSVGPDVIRMAGPAANGLIYLYEIDLNRSRQNTERFVEEYHSKYSEDPELFSSLTYDTLMLIKEHIKGCGLDSTCLKNTLYTADFEGVTGKITFDHNGDIIREKFTPMIIRNNAFMFYALGKLA